MFEKTDYRKENFVFKNVGESGKFLGNKYYWKLYVIENILRVIINSILKVQIGINWWAIAIDPNLPTKIQRVKNDYISHPNQSKPGTHDIYYIFLPDLNNILRINSNIIYPVIPTINRLILKIERIRIPRNIIGHMNWLKKSDRIAIDKLYNEMQPLIRLIEKNGIKLLIPK